MKMKKLLALALTGALAFSLLTACGGEAEEPAEEETEAQVEQVEEAEAAEGEETEEAEAAEGEETEEAAAAEGEAVSEETWATMMENATLFGQYNKAAEAMGEEIPDELVAYVGEINERAKEVAAMTKDNTTEEAALAANDDICDWIETFAQYITLEEAAE